MATSLLLLERKKEKYLETFRWFLSRIITLSVGAVERLTNELYSQKLISDSLYDEIITTTGVTDLYKATKLMRAVERSLSHSCAVDVGCIVLKFTCKILLCPKDPGLEKVSKNILEELEEAPEVIAVSVCDSQIKSALVRIDMCAFAATLHAEDILCSVPESLVAVSLCKEIIISIHTNPHKLDNLVKQLRRQQDRKCCNLADMLEKESAQEYSPYTSPISSPLVHSPLSIGQPSTLRFRLPSEVEQSVTDIISDYDDLISNVVKLFRKASQSELCTLDDLKSEMKGSRHFYGYGAHIDTYNTVDGLVRFAARKSSSLLNVQYLDRLVKKFEIPYGEDAVKDYKSLLDKFRSNTKVTLLNKVPIAKAIAAKAETIEFTTRREPHDTLIDEIEQIIQEMFDELSVYIHINVMGKRRSITVVCYAPESIIGLLILKAQKKLNALKRKGLISLTIGYCTLLDFDSEYEINKPFIEELEERKSELRHQIEVAGKELSSLQAGKDSATELLEKIDKLEKEKTKMEDDLQKQKDVQDNLQQKLQEAIQAKEDYEVAIERLKEENAKEDYEIAIERLKEENEKLRNQVDSFKASEQDGGHKIQDTVIASTESTSGLKDDEPLDQTHRISEETLTELRKILNERDEQILELSNGMKKLEDEKRMLASQLLAAKGEKLPLQAKTLEEETAERKTKEEEITKPQSVTISDTVEGDRGVSILEEPDMESRSELLMSTPEEPGRAELDQIRMLELRLRGMAIELDEHRGLRSEKEKLRSEISGLQLTMTEKDEKISSLQLATTENEKKISSLELATTEREEKISNLQHTIERRVPVLSFHSRDVHFPPVTIVMPNFAENKKNKQWYSPSFYTHPEGYKLCLKVVANGQNDGKGTHVSAYVHLMAGEHDDKLSWPFSAEIELELLNRQADENHIQFSVQFGKHSLPNIAGRVYSACLVDSGMAAWEGEGKDQLIKHTDLSFDRANQTEYLKDDSLFFKCKKITIASSISRPPSPTEASGTTSSIVKPTITRFVLSGFSKLKSKNGKKEMEAFYTRKGGYKFRMVVYPNGVYEYKGSCVAVFIHLMKGEHDDKLKFPFRGIFHIQAVNLLEDEEQMEGKNHVEFTVKFTEDYDPDGKHGARVTTLSADNLISGHSTEGFGVANFLRHDLLPHNKYRNTKYLTDDDKIIFRIAKVEVFSDPVL